MLQLKDILEKYPEQRPTTFNYTEARELILSLYELSQRRKNKIIDEASIFLQNNGFNQASRMLDRYCDF